MFKTSLMLVAAAALASSFGVRAFAASADDTRLASSSGSITDSTGAKWTLSGGYIYVNGVRDTHSANVICLAYEGGRVWQENASHFWYEKTKSSDTWAPSGGTQNSPLPPITASVANGTMKIRTDPQTIVGLTAIGSNNNYQGSTTVITDNYGNVSVPTSSLFGHNTYKVSQFRKPMLLSNYADVTMISLEKYYFYNPYWSCCSDNYTSDLQTTYGSNVSVIDWSTLFSLQQASSAAFAAFAKSLGRDDALVLYNGSAYDGSGYAYVARTYTTSTTIASISNVLYLDHVYYTQARVAYHNYGASTYTFNTVGSVSVVVP